MHRGSDFDLLAGGLMVSVQSQRTLITPRGHGSPRRNKSGDVAQMGEQYVRNVQVRGSIPLISTIILKNKDLLNEKKCGH